MQLLEYVVREDWQHLTQQMRKENERLWRSILGLAALSSLALVLLTLLRPPEVWRDACQIILSSCAFIAFALWTAFRSEKRAYSRASVAYLFLVGAAIVGRTLRPQPGQGSDPFSVLSTLLGSLTMLTSWIILFWAHRQQPEKTEQLGITPETWPVNLLLGVVIGTTLGAHLMLTRYFAGRHHLHRPLWTTLLWHLCYHAGLRSLGEELLFRGLGFRLLYRGSNKNFWQAAARVSGINFLVYLIPSWPILSMELGIWVLPYLLVMMMVNAALRQWRQSLIPGLACSTAFNLVLLTVNI